MNARRDCACFGSADDRFSVEVSALVVKEIVSECATAGGAETGGVLVGRYSDDCQRACVVESLRPPPDSRGTRGGFLRGILGLWEALRRRWNRGEHRRYYLGEWHSHPGGPPTPSSEDRRSMLETARDRHTNCPEAVLLLVGGDCRGPDDMQALIFTRKGEQVMLART